MAVSRESEREVVGAGAVSPWIVALVVVVLAIVLLAIFYGFAIQHWAGFDKPS